MEPEVIAQITNAMKSPNGNAASLPYVTEAVRNDPSIYPSAEVMGRLTIESSPVAGTHADGDARVDAGSRPRSRARSVYASQVSAATTSPVVGRVQDVLEVW